VNLSSDGSAPIEWWPHSAPDFAGRLKSLEWFDEWETMRDGLLLGYKADPLRFHAAYEAFIRGRRGYVPMIFMAKSPAGTFNACGFLCSCGINPEVPEEDCLKELCRLGAWAITQFLAEKSGNPNYFVGWDKPLP
jgi:hypothetical protein